MRCKDSSSPSAKSLKPPSPRVFLELLEVTQNVVFVRMLHALVEACVELYPIGFFSRRLQAQRQSTPSNQATLILEDQR